MGLGRMLEKSAYQFSQNVALIYNGEYTTYAQLNRMVNSLSNRMKGFGLQKGAHIATMLPNIPEFVITYFAIQKIGAVAVTINALSTAYELRYLLENSDAQMLITTLPLAKRFEEIKKDIPLCKHLLIVDDKDSPFSFQRAIEEGPFYLTIPEMAPDDPAVMIYTSGLTGKPLGAVLTQHNLLTQSELIKDVCGGNEKDRALAVIPLFHAFGAAINMLAPIRMGAGIVLMDRFTVDGIFQAIERESVSYIAAVPRLFLGMLFQEGTERYDIRSLKYCITGGSAMPPEMIRPFEKKFGVKVMEGYGLTEASPVCSFSRLDMPQKPGSIGVSLPGIEAKVFDENDMEVQQDKIGELVIKGVNVMKGYYKDEPATTQVLRNGWLHTGDLARIDEEGYIFLTGRRKRMIITSGFNVYPKEVEDALGFHSAVKTARVSGKEDLLRGEIVKALIVKHQGASADEKEILKHCRIYLSSYKVPREIEFVDKIEG
jgi:long-chain acyl-CoA synthetase